MSPVFDPEETRSRVGGLVHLDTQRADVGLDLTVAAIARITGPGHLDFGGSERQPAPREALAAERASPDDDYGWWTLDPGTYMVRFNESLALEEGEWAWIAPLPRLLHAGAHLPTYLVDDSRDSLETLLSVGEGGCRIKENARIARVVVGRGA